MQEHVTMLTSVDTSVTSGVVANRACCKALDHLLFPEDAALPGGTEGSLY